MGSEILTRQVMEALARRRAVGLHFLAHALGIEGDVDCDSRSTSMLLRLAPAEEMRSPSALAIGALADLAMGQAIRAQMPRGLRLATNSMTLHSRTAIPARGSEYAATARVSWAHRGNRTATATVQIHDESGEMAAVGSGAFSALPPPDGQPLRGIDWARLRQGPLPHLSRDELDDEERTILETLESAASPSATLPEALLSVDWMRLDPEGAEGETLVTVPLENRAGQLQGGAVYGLIVLGAQQSASEGFQVGDVRVQFLRPGVRGAIRVRARMLRRGRTVAFLRVVLDQGETQVAEGTVTLVAR